jgi:hypothetical protein
MMMTSRFVQVYGFLAALCAFNSISSVSFAGLVEKLDTETQQRTVRFGTATFRENCPDKVLTYAVRSPHMGLKWSKDSFELGPKTMKDLTWTGKVYENLQGLGSIRGGIVDMSFKQFVSSEQLLAAGKTIHLDGETYKIGSVLLNAGESATLLGDQFYIKSLFLDVPSLTLKPHTPEKSLIQSIEITPMKNSTQPFKLLLSGDFSMERGTLQNKPLFIIGAEKIVVTFSDLAFQTP